MKRVLILANGTPPGKRLFKKIRANSDMMICADGGANIAARFDSTPDLIIGDLDSVTGDTLRKFHAVHVKQVKDQNSTDLEKALTAAIQTKCEDIIVLGAMGKRFDHAISNLGALEKFSKTVLIKFIDDSGVFIPVHRLLSLSLPVGTTISLLPLTSCKAVVTKGLKWNLNNGSLQFGVRESTRNVVVSSQVTIKVRNGSLIAYIMNL